jgi:hypothetical protein
MRNPTDVHLNSADISEFDLFMEIQLYDLFNDKVNVFGHECDQVDPAANVLKNPLAEAPSETGRDRIS